MTTRACAGSIWQMQVKIREYSLLLVVAKKLYTTVLLSSWKQRMNKQKGGIHRPGDVLVLPTRLGALGNNDSMIPDLALGLLSWDAIPVSDDSLLDFYSLLALLEYS
jgi:hypothetical protein